MFFKESEGFWNDFFHILSGSKRKLIKNCHLLFVHFLKKANILALITSTETLALFYLIIFFYHYGGILNLQIRIYEQEIKMYTV